MVCKMVMKMETSLELLLVRLKDQCLVLLKGSGRVRSKVMKWVRYSEIQSEDLLIQSKASEKVKLKALVLERRMGLK